MVCESFDVLSCQTALEVERFSQHYVDVWSSLDPDSTGFIPVERTQELLESMPLPFGAPKNKFMMLSTYFKLKAVRLKTLFVMRNMTGSKLSFHETFLLLVILHSIEERRLESARYSQYVKRMKAELIVYNFVRVKGRPYALVVKYSRRLARRLRIRASGKRMRLADAFVSSHSNNLVKKSQNVGVTSKLCRAIKSQTHVAADQWSNLPSWARPSSPMSVESRSASLNEDVLKSSDGEDKVQEMSHVSVSSAGGLLKSRLESHRRLVSPTNHVSSDALPSKSLKNQQNVEANNVTINFLGRAPLPSAGVCKSSFNAETVCAISQNERWIPFLGWSPHVLLPSDPGAFSSVNRKTNINLSDDVPSKGPWKDLWAPPEVFAWKFDESWRLQELSDRDFDSEGCRFDAFETIFF